MSPPLVARIVHSAPTFRLTVNKFTRIRATSVRRKREVMKSEFWAPPCLWRSQRQLSPPIFRAGRLLPICLRRRLRCGPGSTSVSTPAERSVVVRTSTPALGCSSLLPVLTRRSLVADGARCDDQHSGFSFSFHRRWPDRLQLAVRPVLRCRYRG